MFPHSFQDDSEPPAGLSDRYQILSVIGEGGFGRVYKARHSLMGRTVAIKVLHDATPDTLMMRRFQKEAQAASNLTHPNIVTVYDFGISSTSQLYLVMDYVEGIDLDRIVESSGPMQVDRALNIFIQAAEALEHAHQRYIIHRDLKPSNIMLATDEIAGDFVKIVDFGLAKLTGADGGNDKLTQTGDVIGTPLFMSPEQCLGDALDARSDIYALGCIMYYALTGHYPLEGKNVLGTLYQQISSLPVPFSNAAPGLCIPANLEKVVFKTLQKKPEGRYQSMAELAAELRIIQQSLVDSPRKVPSANMQHSSKLILGLCALAVFVLAFIAPAAVGPRISAPSGATASLPIEKAPMVAKQVQTLPPPIDRPKAKKSTSNRPRSKSGKRPRQTPVPAYNPAEDEIADVPYAAPDTYGRRMASVDLPVTEAEPMPQYESPPSTKMGRISKAVESIAGEYLSSLSSDGSEDASTLPAGPGRKLGKYRNLLKHFAR